MVKKATKVFIGIVVFAGFVITTAKQLDAQNCTVNAGIFREWCTTDDIQLFGNLQGRPQVSTATWRQVGGPTVTIDDPNDLESSLSNVQGGNTYVFRLEARCQDGSRIFDDVTYEILGTPSADAGDDIFGCPDFYALNGSTPATDETGIWTVEDGPSGSVNILNINDPNSSIELLEGSGGEVTLRWTIIDDINGCEDFDEITVINCGGSSVVDAGPDQVLDDCFTLTTSTSMSASGAGLSDFGCGQLGTWTVVSGPNIPAISDINSPSTSVSNLIQGTYVLRWTVTGECAAGTDIVTIEVPEPLGEGSSASIDGGSQVYCDGRTETVLQGNEPDFINEVVEWECTGGPCMSVVFGSPNQPVTSVSGLDGTSTYTFTYTITNTITGCSSSSSITVSYADPPTIEIDSDVVLECGETVAEINYTATGGVLVEWRLLDGPNISSPTSWSTAGSSPFEIPGFFASGEYILELRNNSVEGNACIAATDQITVEASFEAKLANAGTDQKLACNVDSTNLAGNDPLAGGGIGVGTWTQVSGPTPASILEPNADDSPITDLFPGMYVFRWTITDGRLCTPNEDDVIVRVADTIPLNVDAGPDRIVCWGTPIQLEGSIPDLNETGRWTVVPDDGIVFDDSTLFNTFVNDLEPNTSYTFTWTIFNGCDSISDNVVITTTNIQGPIEADAGLDLCLPNDTSSVTMQANPPGNGTGTWTQLTGPIVTIVDPGDHQTEITGLANDNTYSFEWRIETDPFCDATTDTVFISLSSGICT